MREVVGYCRELRIVEGGASFGRKRREGEYD
jgi:hypothetical protein